MTTTTVSIYHSGDMRVAERLHEIIQGSFPFSVEFREAHYSPGGDGRADARQLLIFVLNENAPRDLFGRKAFAPHAKIAVLDGDLLRGPEAPVFAELFDDFIFRPIREDEVTYRVRRLMGGVSVEEKDYTKRNMLQKLGLSHVIGQDVAFREVISKIQMVADTDVTILLTGETGVGKEVCARAIHYLSKRSDKPFVPVDCGAIPTNLVENELFGHSKGAYTDANRRQFGVIAEAEGGTLFLDEIDALPLEAQSKLLRVLQDKTYRPLGENKSVQADVRLLVAANVNLMKKINNGQFRQDLFYRFSVPLNIPPLRERKEDIPLLAGHFLKKYGSPNGVGHKRLSPAAMQKLLLYQWPGNIRQLENVIQQASLLTRGSVIPSENINIPLTVGEQVVDDASFTEAKRLAIEAFEKDYIARLLVECNGNITRAAERAQKDRSDFSKMIKKYDLKAVSFRTPEN